MAETLQRIMGQQRRWAEGRHLQISPKGYVPLVDNLVRPLSNAARDEFKKGAGGELEDRNGRPAKMGALHSSSALVCNVFEYWRERDPAVVGTARGLPVPIAALRFEAPLQSGSPVRSRLWTWC